MHRILIGLTAALALTGCAAAAVDPVTPPPSTLTAAAVPEDGQALRDLGFGNAPEGLSVPLGAEISDRVDSANNVTVVMTAPDALEVADYLRRTLPTLGFTITGDAQNSLIFEGGGWQGAFTASKGYAALTLRTDR